MIYIIVLVCSFILTYFVKEFALKKSLVAEINERSSHTVPTPHGGGIAIALTWFGGITYLYITNVIEFSLYGALLSGVIISVISYVDDLIELSPKIRLLAQALTAFFGLYFLGGLHEINLFFFQIDYVYFTNIFAFFMIIWFINLYNFLDGIDGYAGSEAIFIALGAYTLFGGEHFLVLAAAVLGFLLWNWHKAKIFMGDVGSTLLGYNVAIFTIYYANEHSSNFWIFILLFSLFWFDATLTLLRRYKNGEKLSQAHKKHTYQRLVQSGWRHDKVVLASILVNLFILSLIYIIDSTALLLFITLILLFFIVKFVDKKKEFE
ncbi:MAG: glycosyltransferase family 4 protein [Campylobacterales bacterium]|nr:glycosyltransferase family 4 protein [Campylobacterales bacterium]